MLWKRALPMVSAASTTSSRSSSARQSCAAMPRRRDLRASRSTRRRKQGGIPVEFAVGFKLEGKSDHVVVDGEDGVMAAVRGKVQEQQALITYVRHANKRGDTRHPMHGLDEESR